MTRLMAIVMVIVTMTVMVRVIKMVMVRAKDEDHLHRHLPRLREHAIGPLHRLIGHIPRSHCLLLQLLPPIEGVTERAQNIEQQHEPREVGVELGVTAMAQPFARHEFIGVTVGDDCNARETRGA